MALANCLASGKGKKTAVLELENENCFRWLADEKKAIRRNDAFRYQKIDFYFGTGRRNPAAMFNMDYDALIFDLGKNVSEYREMFLTSDRKLVLCVLQKWKRKEAEIMLERFQNPVWGYLTPDFYTISSSDDERKKFERRSGVTVKQLPWIPDPFHLTVNLLPVLSDILGNGPY
ncbi:MAG: hypothetical protein K6E13_00800 [Lachnospiraceae bacterium]|nr:hypothetical protein [Lachnospiraceae bacterium]